jgi:hypothetical protein
LVRTWYAPKRDISAVFVHEFGENVPADLGSISTPTDYFRYKVTVTDAAHPATNPLYTLTRNYAFLVENQWVAHLPEVSEDSPGAAPDELGVYYCDMFPFRKDVADPSTWLPREEVTAYVGAELVPQMVETFGAQTDEWGFPWSDAWTSYRPKDPERLSVALVDGQTWFHGRAPASGDAGISINASNRDNAGYGSLTDALMSTFDHELFHNLQRSLNLGLGGDGRVGGEGNRWKFFSEGTAVLASSVGQPLVHLGPSSQKRTYMTHANRHLLWGGGRFQDLIVNYDEVDPYHAAFYWRFLFEQCGGMQDGVWQPAVGMEIVRRALTLLYAGDLVDIGSSADLVQATPEVLDQALAGSSCPFQSYEESLVAFSRAIYGLRVEGGRCTGPGIPSGCGLYDPYDLYADPSVSTLSFSGVAQEARYETTSGAGTDLIDIVLDPAVQGQGLTLEFQTTVELDVRILFLIDGRVGARPRRLFAQGGAVEVAAGRTSDGHLLYSVPGIRAAASSRLGLIVTRLDGEELLDSVEEYTVLLRPHSNLCQPDGVPPSSSSSSSTVAHRSRARPRSCAAATTSGGRASAAAVISRPATSSNQRECTA